MASKLVRDRAQIAVALIQRHPCAAVHKLAKLLLPQPAEDEINVKGR